MVRVGPVIGFDGAKTTMENMEPIQQITALAIKHGWRLLVHQEENLMVSYVRNGDRINIWYTKMTVATCIDHPTKGKTQLFRRHVSWRLLERIFSKPRIHTGRGYYTRY